MRVLQIKGEVHHDRRLHQLMLLEASKEWHRTVKAVGFNPSTSRNIKGEVDDSEKDRVSFDSYPRASSSPTDSVSSLHDTLQQNFRWGSMTHVLHIGSPFCKYLSAALGSTGAEKKWSILM